jgi:hypothetical protein
MSEGGGDQGAQPFLDANEEANQQDNTQVHPSAWALPSCLRVLAAAQGAVNQGEGGLRSPMSSLALRAWRQDGPRLQLSGPGMAFSLTPWDLGAEAGLHALVLKTSKILAVHRKLHRDDEAEALLYVENQLGGEALRLWEECLLTAQEILTTTGIGANSVLGRALWSLLLKYTNPKAKADLNKRLMALKWDPRGVAATQTRFMQLFREADILAQRTAHAHALARIDQLTFQAQLGHLERTWPDWAQALATTYPAAFSSINATWAMLTQHEPRALGRTSTVGLHALIALPDEDRLAAAAQAFEEGDMELGRRLVMREEIADVMSTDKYGHFPAPAPSAHVMAILARNGLALQCWGCGGNHRQVDCPRQSADAAAGARPTLPTAHSREGARWRQAPQAPPAPLLPLGPAGLMDQIRLEMREFGATLRAEFQDDLRARFQGVTSAHPAPASSPAWSPAQVSSPSPLMSLGAPAASAQILCGMAGSRPPPGYVAVQQDATYSWFAPADFGPAQLDDSLSSWNGNQSAAGGLGNDPGAV